MKKGFTLLEILLVVGIIAILAGIVIVALNPTKQFAQVRNTQRKANLSELNKALYQYYIDNSRYPTSVTTTLTEICDTEATSTGHSLNCTNKIDLSPLVPTYLVAIPTDPQASGTSTGYLVAKNTANKIHLKADNAELAQTTVIGDTSGVLPDHLVSYWSFDDAGAGTALDTMGINNGTVVGATATTGVKGLSNTAYAFDGVNDYVNFGGNNSLKITSPYLTYSAWVRWTNMSRWTGILGSSVSNKGVSFGFSDTGTFRWYVVADTQQAVTTGITENVWTNIVGVVNGTRIRLYINGVDVGNNSMTGNIIAQDFIWAGENWDNYFRGSIDNVRIYNKALSVDEITALYNTEKP